MLILVRGSSLTITYTLMTCVSSKNSIARARVLVVTVTTSAYIMRILKTGVAWSVLGAYTILVSNGGSCRGDSSLASRISASTLFIIIRNHFRHYVFALSNLRTVFHAIGLLDEEHVAVVLRSLHDFGASSAVLNIDSETLVRLWAYRSVMVIGARSVGDSHLILMRILILRSRRSSISSPEATKSGGVHLLLKKVAWVSIMDIWSILESLNQIGRITSTTSVSIEWATSSSFARVLILSLSCHIVDILDVSNARLSSIWLSLIRELSLGVLKQLINIAGILILRSLAMKLTLMGSITFPTLSMFMILNFIWIILTCLDCAML